MPELPEAETIRRQLEPEVTGARIRRIEVHIARSARSHESPEELAALVEGRTIRSVGRRGKAVLLFLDRKAASTLVIRLGMSGVVRVASAQEPREKHLAGLIELSNKKEIRYIDVRQFGLMVARLGHEVDAMPEFARYGPEPFSEAFTAEYLRQALARRSTNLEAALMDQGLVAGLGKIYTDEVLFRAGIKPTRKANSLTGPKVQRLWQSIRETLEEAIVCGGTSAEDETYRDVYGMAGNFQDRLMVYQRTGQPCRVCGTTIRRQKMTGGRGMHWCPKCQK